MHMESDMAHRGEFAEPIEPGGTPEISDEVLEQRILAEIQAVKNQKFSDNPENPHIQTHIIEVSAIRHDDLGHSIVDIDIALLFPTMSDQRSEEKFSVIIDPKRRTVRHTLFEDLPSRYDQYRDVLEKMTNTLEHAITSVI